VSDVTELAAAIRDAMDVPIPFRLEDADEHRSILAARAAYLRGALDTLAGGDDSAARNTVKAVRSVGRYFPVTYPTRDEQPEPDPSPLVAYRDAVVDALLAAGIGVRDNEADEAGPSIGIDLDPLDAHRTPVLVWTPSAGWRIGLSDGSAVDPDTIRYVGQESAPPPSHVATHVNAWQGNPDHLQRTEPAYGAMPRGALAEHLARSAGSGS
jgi:Family of unknown function (DUF6292)